MKRRAPDEIAGFYMLEGGAPCVIDAYMGYLERFIVEQRLDDLFLLVPGADNDHCGYDQLTLAKYTLPALLVADIMVEIEQVIDVVGDADARAQLKQRMGTLHRDGNVPGAIPCATTRLRRPFGGAAAQTQPAGLSAGIGYRRFLHSLQPVFYGRGTGAL